MKIKSLILLTISFTLLISCEKDMKWINEVDENADVTEMTKMCEANKAECGSLEIEYNGKKTSVFCGECSDGYDCSSDNQCLDIDECADTTLNDCPEKSDCHNLDTKSDGKPYECICKENYSGDDCDPDTRRKDCEGLPENAEWNSVSEITQTWNGEGWLPTATGSFNEEASTKICRFKCKEHYSWKNSQCAADTIKTSCEGLPENAEWNSVSEITQTWNGDKWAPSNKGTFNEEASETECRYKCLSDFHREYSTCVSNTRTNVECTGLPEHATWNTAESITQTWSGSEWLPGTTGTWNTDASTSECRFKCNEHYNWNSSNKTCDAATQQEICQPKPANTVWNDGGKNGKFTQIWTDSGWTPASYASEYNTDEGTCHYKCDSTHTRENGSCINQKSANCSAKPANTVWNDNGANGTFNQNWTSSNGWSPTSYTSTYNETAGTCRYKCDSAHTWENGSCINQKTANCSAKPANTVWNDSGANGTFTQSWSSSNGWSPTSYTSSYSTTAGVCKYKCDSTHTWENGSCINQKTANCSAKPANTVWNDNGANGTFNQNWSSSNGWTPTSYTSSYSTTAGVCRYKCDSSHFWDNSECTNPCDFEPCEEITNSTHECTATSWQDYSCECNSGYFWNGSECKQPLALGNICTGQDKCYNNNSTNGEITCPTSSSADFYGQDAQYRKCTPQNFTPGTGVQTGTVIDDITGLVWEQSPSEQTYTWDNAQNHCADLNSSNYGGKSNWRVPNPLELLTIVDNSKYNPATNSNFTNMPSDDSVWFWTSAEYKGDTSYAYAFRPYYGSYYGYKSDSYSKTKTYKVLCVSGDEMQPATSANFTTQTISGKVVVTDSRTGLMWQKEYVTSKTWQEALKYCEDSTYAGYSDWRLPNKNELASLINYEKSRAPYSYFPDMPSSSYFWSSSTYVYRTSHARYVDFYNGYVDGSGKTGNYYVRCVRFPVSLGNICTGQNKCNNGSSVMGECPAEGADFFGQDAQYTGKCSVQNFTPDTDKGIIIDNNTGLTWEKSPSESSYTWDDAPNHCTELNSSNYGGKSNWRVPNPLELLTIVDNSTYNPATNSNFTNMPTDSSVWFWTSAENKSNTDYAYAFKPYYGNYYGYASDSYLKTNTYKVLCVSGDEMQPATSADFTAQTISGKVVVTDSKTGLMWQKEYETGKTWQQALKYCEDSTYAGYSDWRLPNKNELASLLDPGKSGAPYSNFPDMPSDWFWSSSICVVYTNGAWNVNFYYGFVNYSYQSSSNVYVRCVR